MPRRGKSTQTDGKCGSKKTKKKGKCENTAGKGTDHVGYGRCKHHGGSSKKKAGGLYSTVTHEKYRVPYDSMLENKEVLASVDDEIAFLRICAMKSAAGAEALLDPDQRKKACELGLELGILDNYSDRIHALTEILERITRAIKRKVEIEQGIAIRLTPMQISNFIDTFKAIVTRHITDTKVIAAIGRDIAKAFG
jgi:hypothetical protein